MRSFQPKRAETGRAFQPPPQREPAHKRGYDRKWARLRGRYIQIHPVCEYCNSAPATEVDHVKPFNGMDDPLRLNWANLKSACRSCHAKKTYRDKRGD